MLLVISPAKNLDFESTYPSCKHSQCSFLQQAQNLVEQLRTLSPQQISKLMGISDKLGTLNYDRYQSWQRPFNKSNARPAVFAFNGDVYQGLQAASFNEADLAFAQQHLRILSGLYGVLRPLDLMQAYRLEMGTKLATERGANLYDYWQQSIAGQLNKQLKKLEGNTLINLASNEYFKAVDPNQLDAEIITPVFKEKRNGKYKIISFSAKKARGLMAAYIIKNQLTAAENIKNFASEGYDFNSELSSSHDWVFTREAPSKA
ncbi:MAG: peroxide stress protein YaaA [Cellvibrionaceae bacterium]|nr:peroxide stress protein YaaA [Cellvibrionaceae bacterium]